MRLTLTLDGELADAVADEADRFGLSRQDVIRSVLAADIARGKAVRRARRPWGEAIDAMIAADRARRTAGWCHATE
ncbi:MAG: hypothetical protein OXC29_13465 [Rhodococcus sp.]|nr:hypothetical protein [Rhodococcus sp. (in: high G+C Gram-positive bacteria)]